jgi:hypothetical protein
MRVPAEVIEGSVAQWWSSGLLIGFKSLRSSAQKCLTLQNTHSIGRLLPASLRVAARPSSVLQIE